MMRRVLWVTFTMALGVIQADAVPRYAARYEMSCNLCHHNPTGGGQRSLYASQYLVPAEMVKNPVPFEELDSIDPQVGKNLIVGADMRTMHQATVKGVPALENFFQMQADVYLTFELDESRSLYVDRGMSETGEVFGLAYGLPASGYAKVGRFLPAYGWRFADHSRFVREKTGLAPPSSTDVGLEVGFHPGRAEAQFSLLNGASGLIWDNDDTYRLGARGAYRFRVGGVGVTTGGSVLYDQGKKSTLAGPFGSAHWGRWTWLGEADLSTADDEVQGLVVTHELAYQMRTGFDLVGTYDFYDADMDRMRGAERAVGFGIDTLWSPFFHIAARVRALGPTDDDFDTVETMVQAHWFY